MNKRERLIDAYEYLRSTGVIHTKKDFAQKINFGVTNLSAAFGGNESYLTKGLFDKIAIAFPNVFNEEWLHEGKKPMLKNNEPVQIDFGSSSTDQSDQLFHTVPLVPTSAQGGPLNDFVTSIKENECERIVSPVKYADLAITVAGDSMAPEFPSGCQILIKRINEKAFIEWGKVYVLDTCNGTVIKEVHRGKDDDEIECYSINPDPKFQPFSVKFADIFGMYRVIMCMSLK